ISEGNSRVCFFASIEYLAQRITTICSCECPKHCCWHCWDDKLNTFGITSEVDVLCTMSSENRTFERTEGPV
ncbi:hypothetical protein M758_10G072300, partial [Ceratodon purpureus]